MPKIPPSLDFDAFEPEPEGRLTRLFRSGLKMRMRLLIFFGLAVMVMVPVNALFLQEGRHPAPLFHLAALPPEPPRAVPLPPQRPAAIAQAKSEPAKADPAKAESLKKTSGGADPIADLIDGRLPKPDAKPHHGEESARPASDNKTVLFAQRALVKLGYVLHEDGVFGGTTRQAIEKFERANRMPVTGELTPKLLKLMSQRTGLSMR